MGLRKNNKLDDRLMSDMSDKQRREKIERLEQDREDVVRRIERLMVKISKETQDRKLRARRLPLGEAPNDLESE